MMGCLSELWMLSIMIYSTCTLLTSEMETQLSAHLKAVQVTHNHLLGLSQGCLDCSHILCLSPLYSARMCGHLLLCPTAVLEHGDNFSVLRFKDVDDWTSSTHSKHVVFFKAVCLWWFHQVTNARNVYCYLWIMVNGNNWCRSVCFMLRMWFSVRENKP